MKFEIRTDDWMGWVEYTPEFAQWIINNRNADNPRKYRERKAKEYARDFENDKWSDSWDCIAFNKEGMMVNGQHRMHGIVISGKTVKLRTIFGMNNNSLGDTGMKRNAIEALHGRNAVIPDVYDSRYGMGFVRQMSLLYLAIYNPTESELENLSNSKGLQKASAIFRMFDTHKKGFRAALVAGIAGAYMVTEDDRIFEFCETLITGISKDPCGACIIALRDWLMTEYTKGSRRDNPDATYAQGAIRAYLNGNVAKRLYKRDALIYTPRYEDFFGED